jgi:hypothetical protein
MSVPLNGQNETVLGSLTVNGELDVITGSLSLGTAFFFDEINTETTAEGLTLHYSETPQTWVDESYAPGRSTVIFQVGQELVDFHWRSSIPDGLGGFTPLDLMKLSNEQLLLQPSLSGLGTENILPNQTMSGGNASILTLGMADSRYLSQSGGSISGNLVVSGSASFTSLNVDGAEVLTEDSENYIKVTSTGEVSGGGANVTAWSGGIGIGVTQVSGYHSVGIGNISYAIGDYCIAIGRGANINTLDSVGIGRGTFSSGNQSIAMGKYAATHTSGSIAIGHEARTTQIGQIVLGNFNELAAYSPITPSASDWLFSIANGTADNARSNALIVKRNGNMEVKGTSLTVNGVEVITQTSLEAAIEDVNLGTGNYISRDAAIGMNYGTGATAAAHSIALGEASQATGSQSSSAVGFYSISNQAGTHSLGNHLVANFPGQIVLGNYNAYGSTLAGSSTAAQNDPVVIVGNGSADNARTNALVIRRNGSIELAGTALTFNESALLTQSSANSLYLTATAAAALYQTLPAPGSQFLTSADLVTIQDDIDGKIGAAELADALADIDLSGNYLSKNPQIGLAYGSGSQALASTSAIGTGAVANQAGAHAIGEYVVANRPGQVVVGMYNEFGDTESGSSTAAATDNVFIVGVGSPGTSGQPDERKNALVVKRDGNVHLTGVMRVPPAGNLLMGEFNEGPQPEETEE